MRKILALLILLAIPAVAQFGGPMGGMRPGSMQGGGLLPGRGGDPLWVAAGPTKPKLDLDFAKRKDLTDAVSGKTSLVTFSRSAAQSPGTYVGADGLIHDAAVNLALYSEQFDLWTNANSIDAANQIASPDGKQTADKLIESGAIPSGTNARVVYSLSGFSASTVHSFSIFAKKAERNFLYLGVGGGGLANGEQGWFDLDTGTTGSTLNGAVLSIESVGNEWYRCSMQITTTGTSGTVVVGLALSDGGLGGYTGDGTSGIYIWGAQLQEGTTATPYIHTTSQALAAPRFDHDPVTGESLGLLVEEARANLFVDSTMVSDVFGTSGAGYVATYTNDSRYSPGRRARLQTTATQRYTSFGTGAYSPSINTSYTISVSVDVVSATNIQNHIGVRFPPSGSTEAFYVDGVAVSSSYAIPSGSHFLQYILNVGATASSFTPVIGCGIYSSTTADITFDTPQFEIGSFATSYIPTTGTSQTRYADIAAVQDEDFSTTNLLAYSESFDVGWSSVGATVTANDIVAPDGQTTADKIIESSGGTYHFLETQSVSFSAATHTVSVYAKYNGRQFLTMQGTSARIGTNVASFDLSDGSVAFASAGTSASISDEGNGWYRLQWSVSATAGTGTIGFFLADQSGVRDDTYSGDGTSGVYLWGASLTETEYPVEYTTTRNLLTDSQDFERSTWVKANSSIVNDVAQAPDGTLTADRIVETGTASHFVRANISIPINGTATSSIYVKKDRWDYAVMQVLGTTPSTCYFELADGGQVTAGCNASVQSVGNGWFRFQMTATATTITTFQIGAAISMTSNFYAGDGTSGMYVWGAQLEPGSTATDYVRTVDTVGKAYQWYEPTEGTVFVEADTPDGRTSGDLYAFSNENNVDPRIAIARTSAINILARYFQSSLQADLNTTTGVLFSHATSYKYNDFSAAADGTLATPDTSGNVPAGLTKFHFKYPSSSGGTWNGHIKRLTYWPVRQSDSTLQVITQ